MTAPTAAVPAPEACSEAAGRQQERRIEVVLRLLPGAEHRERECPVVFKR
jgi:hypothetical protein